MIGQQSHSSLNTWDKWKPAQVLFLENYLSYSEQLTNEHEFKRNQKKKS